MKYNKVLMLMTLFTMFFQTLRSTSIEMVKSKTKGRKCPGKCCDKLCCFNNVQNSSEDEEEVSSEGEESENVNCLRQKTVEEDNLNPNGKIYREGKLALPKDLNFKLDHLLIVAIGGPTRSGKSTFSKKLQKFLQETKYWDIKSIEMDYFFDMAKMEYMYLHGNPQANWETPAAVNWLELSKILQVENEKARDELPKDKKRIILINGFLCFSQRWLRKKFDYSIFFEIDYETCKKRRFATKHCGSIEYFDHCIWDGFQEYGQLPENYNVPFAKFDGTKPAHEIWTKFESKNYSDLLNILSPYAANEDEVLSPFDTSKVEFKRKKFYNSKLNKD